jgi:hypothetical protein
MAPDGSNLLFHSGSQDWKKQDDCAQLVWGDGRKKLCTWGTRRRKVKSFDTSAEQFGCADKPVETLLADLL